MALRPYSATLQQAFRDTLGTPGAPEVIDDAQPVTPVAVVAQVNTNSTASFMRITDGTDNLLVATDGTIDVNSRDLPSTATQVYGSGIGVSTGATIYTVSAGKTFYCMGVVLGGSVAGAGVQLQVSGAIRALGFFPAGSCTVLNGGVIFTATAGQTVTIVHSMGAGNGFAYIWGYEI